MSVKFDFYSFLRKSSDERVRTFIKRLRAKTSKDLIENVSSQGYMITSNWIFIYLNHRVDKFWQKIF